MASFTPRVAGTREFTLQYTYSVFNTMGIIGLDNINLTFTRPIFIAAA